MRKKERERKKREREREKKREREREKKRERERERMASSRGLVVKAEDNVVEAVSKGNVGMLDFFMFD
jgi:hypothetical protein